MAGPSSLLSQATRILVIWKDAVIARTMHVAPKIRTAKELHNESEILQVNKQQKLRGPDC